MMYLKFFIFLITTSIVIIFLIKGLIKLINTNLMKKSYRLTNKFHCYFTYIIVFLLALIIGKKLLYSIL